MSAPVIFRIFLRSMGIKKNRLFSVAWWGVGGGGGGVTVSVLSFIIF